LGKMEMKKIIILLDKLAKLKFIYLIKRNDYCSRSLLGLGARFGSIYRIGHRILVQEARTPGSIKMRPEKLI